jgi:hypothetical protein
MHMRLAPAIAASAMLLIGLLGSQAAAHEEVFPKPASQSPEDKIRLTVPPFKPAAEPGVRPGMAIEEVRAKSELHNFELLGQVPLTWPGAGGQIALSGDYAYVGLQRPASGTDIIDVRDPANPKRVGHVDPPGPNLTSHKVRICGDVMVTNAERNFFADPKTWQGGLVVWSLKDPVRPRQIAFLKMKGDGAHRIFYDCPTQRVYVNANEEGFLDKIEWVVDMAEPAKPKVIGRVWFPGQKAGEARNWSPGHPFGSFNPELSVRVHNVTPDGDRLYAAFWDAGLTIWDIKDISAPKLLGQGSTAPPDQGSMHSAYPIRGYPLVATSDEWFMTCPQGYMRFWSVVDPKHPLQISTFQLPINKDCEAAKARPFVMNSAHAFAEPPTLSQQDWPAHLLFVTWFGQGLRVVDISDPYVPTEVGRFIAPAWPASYDVASKGPQFYASDSAIDWKRRLVFVTDRVDQGGAGLYILKWTGDDQPKPIKFHPQ